MALLALILPVLLLGGNSTASASAEMEMSGDVELVYFYPRFRCVSCEQVDSFAAEAAATYSGNGKEGIPYSRLAIDDPVNREKVERYGVVGSSFTW